MKETIKYRIIRKIMFCTGLLMVAEIIFPTVAFALTSAQAQPEFSSFEPVATTNMVNEFSGDMTYNIPVINLPGANGGGYAMSLSYHSGASSEEEASWVGYGWTLNAGAINRGRNGFADDVKGKTVNYWNKAPANWTATVGGALSLEAFSLDLKNILGGSINASLRYNNYKGFGSSKGIGLSLAKGAISIGYNSTDGDGSFSARINPMAILSLVQKKKEDKQNKDKHTLKDATKAKKVSWNTKKALNDAKQKVKNSLATNSSVYGLYSHSGGERPTMINKYKGTSVNVSFGFIPAGIPLELGANVTLSGSYNRQENVNTVGDAGAADPIAVYGYMYSSDAASSTSSQMDYHTEKDNPYDKRDYYIGIPFSNADNFMMTGEGIGGGFRLYNKTTGNFKPRQLESKNTIINVGAEVEAGLNVGGGVDLGVGFHRFASIGWNVGNNFASYDGSFVTPTVLQDEPYFFRFNNDKGGYYDFKSDGLQSADVKYGGGGAGNKTFSADISHITTLANEGNRSGRSSYVGYHTNAEMELSANSKYYKSYCLSNDIRPFVTRNSTISDEVGEYAVTNEEGIRYVYGLPVFTRKELNMQYDVTGASSVVNKYLVYKNISNTSNLKTKVGEECPANSPNPYASSYLLTEITSPDYIDRSMNGPSDDDFGGYTRFSYSRLYGNNDKGDATAWYQWRTPYTGLTYNRGTLSDQKDDMGGAMAGEKEIYYLDTIVTKTHFAVFETSDRWDGMEAADNNSAAVSSSAKGTKKLKKLDAIKIYAKNTGGTPQLLQTVRFEYYTDASMLCKNLPNADGAVNSFKGKLALRRMWTEYEGAFNAKISPYEFEYKYPTVPYPQKYPAVDSVGVRPYTLGENPDYTYHCLDGWGNYQANGDTRYDNMKTWINQNPSTTFDPAAWQLKVIRLPSGGEIHVQYEQDDYLYVQDKHAQALTSISSVVGDNYYVNLDSTFGALSVGDKNYIRDQIQREYVDGDKKMYFKFLYKMILGSPGPNLNSCASEYITGYCNVKKVAIDGTGLYINLGRKKGGSKKFDLPVKVCRDFVKKERLGMMSVSGNCSEPGIGVSEDADAGQVVEALLVYIAQKLVPGDGELCTAINNDLSYFKIPVPPKGKKGGGLRVKRLLMYDAGIETGDQSLFGSEYIYKQTNGYSSGVATNEPAAIREENPLVEFDPRLKQKFLDKIIAGRDRDQTEKPLGESILPSPSVGYSRVVVTNIHSGKTNTGFGVKEFYTAQDYPMTVEYSGMQKGKDYLPIPGGIINYFVNNIWLSQGYLFKLNEMNGQPRRDATYGGDPNNIDKATLSTESYYDYYSPGEQIPISTSPGQISFSSLGKETEQVMESRGMEDVSNDFGIEFDIDVGFAGPIPLVQFSIIPSYSYNESKIFTHVTNKIVQYPVIQKSVRTYAEGIYHLSENVSFDPYTGKPNTTRTYDGYDKLNLQQATAQKGVYTAFTIPASHQYPSMGQKANNERWLYKSNTSTWKVEKGNDAGGYFLQITAAAGYSPCDFGSHFAPGDLIKLYKKSNAADAGIFHVTDSVPNGDKIYIKRTKNFATSPDTDAGTLGEVTIEVLRSGFTNQLNTNVGGFTTYGASNYSYSYVSRTAFAALLDDAAHKFKKIYATDPFFAKYNDLKLNVSGLCKPFTYPDGSYDATGTNTIFKNSSGYIQYIVSSSISGFTVSCSVYDGTSTVSSISGVLVMTCSGSESDKYKVIIDQTTGQLVVKHYTSACSYQTCSLSMAAGNILPLCNDINYDKVTQVVTASAQTYNHVWPYDTTLYKPVLGANDYEAGSKGKWRQVSSYAYRDTIIGANVGLQRNYKNAGVFDMLLFNWKDPSSVDTTKWIKASTVTKYSPDGNGMEEKDIFGIYSADKFGYNKTQPYVVAKNTDYTSVQFESFEKAYTVNGTAELEDAWQPSGISTKRVSTSAHAGKYSWKMTASDSLLLKPITVTQQMIDKGLSLKVWVNDTAITEGLALQGRLKKVGTVKNFSFTKVANVGNWGLYEMKATSLVGFSLGNSITPVIVNNYGSKTIWVDDVRLQPLDAQVMAYVYDINTLRLIATFDDQHFGMFYQYNGEGKLLRKLVETERGLKTITETQYHSAQQKAR
jgi:hypothetical protein